MPDKDAVRRLIDAETVRQAAIRDRAVQAVREHLLRFEGWYDPILVARFSASIGNIVAAASTAAAATTAAYTARSATALGFDILRTVTADPITGPLRLGVDSWEQVYSRLAGAVRYDVSQGLSMVDAIERVVNRADAMVQTDLQLARRRQNSRTLRGTNARRYRRIIRPEASQSGTCGLCAVAADRTYRVSQLMPIHDRCKCTSLPDNEAQGFTFDLNEDELERIYGSTGVSREFGATYAENLLNVRVNVVNHGELGPVLVNANHRTRILPTA